MTKKLLQSTLQKYLVFSFIVLIISAPIFYFLTEKLYLEDADETLYLRRNEFVKLTMPKMSKIDIVVWNKISKDGKIIPYSKTFRENNIFFTTKYDAITNENEPYHVLKSKIKIEKTPYVLVLKINLIESEDLILSVLILFSLTLTILLTGMYLITKRLSIKLWEPFYNTLKQIEQFEIDKHKEPYFLPSEIEEFHRLNDAITKLIKNNLLIFQSQKEFIENAAHELQTPLAIIQSYLDSLIQQPDLTLEQANYIGKINLVVSKFNKLNKNLLLLSKIESNQFEKMEPILVNKLIKKHLDFFTEQAEIKNITIHFHQEYQMKVNSNMLLTEIVINNLFQNAIKHTHEYGRIEIQILKNRLLFKNSSNDNKLNTNQLFERFSKSHNNPNGNGLGLSIIKKIIDRNHWEIKYYFENQYHIFEIIFEN
ncbi:MAG: HAMP domain-containing histidine kinase [Flavobacteriia bacterium]|nr:HAMP domain-containing histidine kinase [Flavobacteriia bacterium]